MKNSIIGHSTEKTFEVQFSSDGSRWHFRATFQTVDEARQLIHDEPCSGVSFRIVKRTVSTKEEEVS